MYLEEKVTIINMEEPIPGCPLCALNCNGQCEDHCKGCKGSAVK